VPGELGEARQRATSRGAGELSPAFEDGRAAIAVLGPTRTEGAREKRVIELAATLGQQIGRQGYGLVVLGQGQVAFAAGRAARQADAPVVAVAAAGQIDLPGVRHEVLPTSLQAIDRVLELASAVILVHGDLQAVTLLTQIWVWGLEPDAPFRQTILVGEGWPETVRNLADAVGLDPRTRAMVTFAREAPEAVEALRYYVAPR
jgi:hypothetical protein